MSLLGRIHSRVKLGVEHTIVYRLGCADERTRIDDSDVRIGILDDITRIGEVGPFDPEECARRVESGDRCYAAWIGDDLAHYSWVQRTGSHALEAAGIDLPVANGEIWIYNCRTAVAHRGKGIYPKTLQHILDDAFAAGVTCAWIYCADRNIASKHGIERAGFVKTGTLRALRIGSYFRPLGELALAG
jgi:hypothetical protein